MLKYSTHFVHSMSRKMFIRQYTRKNSKTQCHFYVLLMVTHLATLWGESWYWYKLEPASIFRTGQVSGQHEIE